MSGQVGGGVEASLHNLLRAALPQRAQAGKNQIPIPLRHQYRYLIGLCNAGVFH